MWSRYAWRAHLFLVRAVTDTVYRFDQTNVILSLRNRYIRAWLTHKMTDWRTRWQNDYFLIFSSNPTVNFHSFIHSFIHSRIFDHQNSHHVWHSCIWCDWLHRKALCKVPKEDWDCSRSLGHRWPQRWEAWISQTRPRLRWITHVFPPFLLPFSSLSFYSRPNASMFAFAFSFARHAMYVHV